MKRYWKASLFAAIGLLFVFAPAQYIGSGSGRPEVPHAWDELATPSDVTRKLQEYLEKRVTNRN